eukprot:TRINITY_DN7581_c0_g1_i13.p1 TRINITY_DN7581_c0_g1~~TRINITY_DN7581_c0_g1_i13.p1  ORF type:complete len:319 (+),score=25.00 TRINITY_DN7581_c0_g1_i13:155-1111(+)
MEKSTALARITSQGQLGTDDLRFKHHFSKIGKPKNAFIRDISAGLQHSLFASENGVAYACGRCNWRQFLPVIEHEEHRNLVADYFKSLQRVDLTQEKIVRVSAGFQHSLFLNEFGELFACGLNNFGQTGTSSLNRSYLAEFNKVYLELTEGEYIKDIAAGKSHNILLSNKGRVFLFGCTLHNQLGRKKEYDLEICAPYPMELDFLQNGEKAVRVKAGFDRSAILTDQGNCYTWGGEDLRALGGEHYEKPTSIKDLLPEKNLMITDIGLGYMHTLVAAQRSSQNKLRHEEANSLFHADKVNHAGSMPDETPKKADTEKQ